MDRTIAIVNSFTATNWIAIVGIVIGIVLWFAKIYIEAILLKQRVQFGPAPNVIIDGGKQNAWLAAGFDISPLVKYDEVKAISEWSELTNFLQK